MNLIDDEWIPVRRADGTCCKIAPYQVTEDIQNNHRQILAVAAPRPDFDGALTQFLIGLFQTAFSPVTEPKWRQWQDPQSYPTSEFLEGLLKKYEEAFFLYRDGEEKHHRIFMQEDLSSNERKKFHPISYLLIGAATFNTGELNIDLFTKRQREDEDFVMCPHCAAAALYTMQTFAPEGGTGKFTSLRGGGPLTTIVLGDTLWSTICLNVLATDDFGKVAVDEKTFPWLKLEQFPDEKTPSREIHSDDMNPAHVFWGMPRRIQLEFEERSSAASCAVCGENDAEVICRRYYDRAGGLWYKTTKDNKQVSSWTTPPHPQTPHWVTSDTQAAAVHPHPGRIGYGHWLGLVYSVSHGKTKFVPAKVIEQFKMLGQLDGRFWAFGYSMKHMQARSWCDSTMPILNVDESIKDIFSAAASKMLIAARRTSGLLLHAIIQATMLKPEKREETGEISWRWSKWLLNKLKITPPKKTGAADENITFGDKLEDWVETNILSFLESVRSEFWSSTEPFFFHHLRDLRENVVEDPEKRSVLNSWGQRLRKDALRIFDDYSQTGAFDAVDPGRIALARTELSKALGGIGFLGQKRYNTQAKRGRNEQRKTLSVHPAKGRC